MKVSHSFHKQYELLSREISNSIISGVSFFCLGFTNSAIRWRFLGDLRFSWFLGDFFLMEVNTDGTTFGFNLLTTNVPIM